jgi:hypothetical protein
MAEISEIIQFIQEHRTRPTSSRRLSLSSRTSMPSPCGRYLIGSETYCPKRTWLLPRLPEHGREERYGWRRAPASHARSVGGLL